MGGEIEVESKLGQGSIFSFSLALQKSTKFRHAIQSLDEKESTDVKGSSHSAQFENLNVLIVDGNKSSANALSTLMATWGITPSMLTVVN